MSFRFPVSDIYFNVKTSDVFGSLNELSYLTLLNRDNCHYRFKDWRKSENNVIVDDHLTITPDNQQTAVKTLNRLHSEAIKVVEKHPHWDVVNKRKDPDKIAIDFKVDGDFGMGVRSLRCNYMPDEEGYCLNIRTKPPKSPYLEDLDFQKGIKEILLSEELTSGLVLFVADCGQGKTTSAVATSASRLKKFGGHCCAFEDPIEYDYSGFHGESGYCLQTTVLDSFAPYLKAALRKFPTTRHNQLYCGEIRTAKDVRLCLQASAQGCLVLATLHADSVVNGLKRMLSLLSGDGNDESGADLLASSFRFIYNQRKNVNPTVEEGWHQFKITGDVLYALSDEVKNSIRSTFQDKKFDQLTEIIRNQKILVSNYQKGKVTKQVLLRGKNVD